MKERRSALCECLVLSKQCLITSDGPLAFVVSNTLVVIPFVFGCSLFYSVIIYWAIGLHSGAVHFFKFLAFLFLALLGWLDRFLIHDITNNHNSRRNPVSGLVDVSDHG